MTYCLHSSTRTEAAITGQGWVVGIVCNDCEEILSQRNAGRSIHGPSGVYA